MSYKNYEEIARSMVLELEKFSKENNTNIVQVCGPISTGGLGSVDENIKFFKKSIEKLEGAGYFVFDQTVFEDAMLKIKTSRMENGLFKFYDWDLLNKCYIPLFESRLLNKMIFLPDFESSIGSKWEYDMALKNNIEILLWDELGL